MNRKTYEAEKGELLKNSYEDWQREQLTTLLSDVQSEVLALRPELQVSVAVWPVYKDKWGWQCRQGYYDFYEDSQMWLAEGYADALVPQLYLEPQCQWPERITAIASDYVKQARGRMVIVALAGDTRSFASLSQGITRAREAGARGAAISSFGSLEEHDYGADLVRGPFARTAVVPPMPWRESRP